MFICRYVFLNMLDLSAILYTIPKIARYIVMFDKQTCVLVEGCNLDLFCRKKIQGKCLSQLSHLCFANWRKSCSQGWDQQIFYTFKPNGRWVMPAQYWRRSVQFKTFGTPRDVFLFLKTTCFFLFVVVFICATCYLLSMVSDFEFFFVKWKKDKFTLFESLRAT